MKYHLHVFGCQMNEADAQRVGSELEKIGLTYTDHARDADVIVLDTCVVRQSAEDKAYSYITTLKPIKEKRPDTIISVMGCMVGVKGNGALQEAVSVGRCVHGAVGDRAAGQLHAPARIVRADGGRDAPPPCDSRR